MGTIARNFNIGLELHETGLNLLSAEMLKLFPQWFTYTQQILIDPTSGRKLVLDVQVTDPISFSLSPIANLPPADNQILVQASIRFQLSDLQAGGAPVPITAIRSTVQAIASATFANRLVSLNLDSFQVLDLTPDNPAVAPTLAAGQLGFKAALAQYSAVTPAPTDDAFVAILNYLIAVFLQEGLERPIAQFPVPQMQTLPVVQLPVALRGLAVFANRLAFYLRNVDGPLEPPTGPPPEAMQPEPHISIGVVNDTIQQVLRRGLPLTIPVQFGDSSSFFQVMQGSSITIRDTTSVTLQSPDVISIDIQFTAQLNMCLNVKIGDYHVQAPLTLPIGPPSHFAGGWNAFARQGDDGMVHVVIGPKADFLSDAEIIVLPDWRDLFKTAVLAWLKANVSPVLIRVPVIGWVIAKTVEVVVSDLAAVFGAILDGLEGAFLTLIANLVLQVIGTWFNNLLEFEVYKFSARLPIPGIDLTIANIGPLTVADNAGGELVLHCWLSDQGIVVPPPPAPPAPPMPNIPATPGSPQAPSYPAGEFAPAFPLNQPLWANGQEFVYDVVLQQAGASVAFVRRVNITQLTGPDRWQIAIQLEDSQGNRFFQSTCLVDKNSLQPISETSWGTNSESGLLISSAVVFDYVGATAQVTAQIGAYPPLAATVPLPAGASIVPSEEWMFELMTAQLQVGDTGKLARPDLQPGAGGNWARLIPTTLQSGGLEDIQWQGNQISALKVQIQDERMTSTLWLESAGARRALVCQQQSSSGQLTMTLR